MTSKKDINNEIIRKLIHFSSIWIPLSIFVVNYSYLRIIFFIITSLFIPFDILRISSGMIGNRVRRILDALKLSIVFRKHERAQLSGASFMMISATILSHLFDEELFFISFMILIISDSCAAIMGKAVGRHALLDKTLEGSLAFLVSAIFIGGCCVIYIPDFSYPFFMLMIASLVTTIVELISPKFHMDDNLTIPFSFGTTLWLLKYSFS